MRTNSSSSSAVKFTALAFVIALAALIGVVQPANGGTKLKSGTPFLYDDSNDRIVGLRDSDNTETYFPRFTTQAAANSVAAFTPAAPGAIGGTTPAAGSFTTLTVTGTASVSPANATVTMAPTGTGTVVISPATAGTMDKMVIGGVTPLAGTFTTLAASGNVTTSGGIVGYATGAGGTVTQATSKATTVVLNKATGAITLHNASLDAATIVSFTLTNSVVSADDLIACSHHATGTVGAYTVNCRATGSGTAEVNLRNNTAGALGEAIVIKFAVIKAVTS